MKRRLLLLAGTFVALLAAYMAYHYATSAEGLGTVTIPPPNLEDANSGGAIASGDGADANQVKKGLVLQNRDQQGRLESVIRLPVWDKQDDGSYVATNPSAVIYHKQGQRTYIYADSGRIYVDEVAGGMEVRRGWMKGNVKIFLDRGTIPGRPPPGERSRDSLQRDVVRIQTPSVFFDNDKLEIKTDDRVTVFANEADIYGRGLIIRWREAPRELLLLEITHGEQMTIYSVPADMEMISLPGSGAKTSPTSQPADAAKMEKAPPRSTEPASPVPERPSAATGPAAATTTLAPAPQRNIYRARFHDSIRVDVGSRHMHGADVLTLTFELGKEPAKLSRRRRAPAARQAPASRPATTQPQTPPGVKPDAEPAAEPMIITWTGSLTIVPVGHTDNPQDDRFQIEAEGDRVVLWDSKATAICKQFTFQNPQQAGSLKGTLQAPARLIMGDGQQIACEQIHFDRQAGKAHLEGPGSLVRLADVGKEAAADEDALGRIPGQPDANADQITWGQSLDVTFGRREAAGAAGIAERREYIKDAHFKGDVTLVQGKSGDFVECEDLTATMSQGKRGEYLSRAVAIGDVFARQAGTNVIADKVTVNFSEAGDTGAEGRGRPQSVVAEGNVLLLDQDDPNGPLLVVTADVARSNLTRRTAVLIGKPARIVQGANRFEGDEIHLAETLPDGGDANAEPHRTITVDTPGSLEFLTRKGLSGETLNEPRPIRVTWTEHMHYRSAADEAEFRGNVRLRGGRDAIDCRRMQLNFEKLAPATTGPAGDAATTTRPAKRQRGRKMTIDMENYSRRKIATIVADGDVVVKSERLDLAGRLIRQLRLTGDQLVYDANKSEMNVFGTGTLFVADYRPPSKTRATKPEGAGDRIDRPNQILFTWGKLMSLTQSPDDRRVIMKGDSKRGVTAVFVSGRYMQLTERLDPPPPPWPELAAGRIGRLRCDTLDVAFDDPNDQRATGRSDRIVEGGPRVGPVKSFRAEGGVNLIDGDRQRRQAVCETMTYDASTDLVKLIGSASPRSRKPATLRFEDLDTRRTQQFSGSQILWFRKGNKDRVVVKDATGATTR